MFNLLMRDSRFSTPVINRFLERRLFDNYIIVVSIVIALAIGIFFLRSPQTSDDLNLLLVVFAAVISFFYYVQNIMIAKTKLFAELFVQFNARYDKLNSRLNAICRNAEVEEYLLDHDDVNVLFDYFNLCSEEYLFYRQGYIPIEVWQSWCSGIMRFLENDKIKQLWDEEMKNSESYYWLTYQVVANEVRK